MAQGAAPPAGEQDLVAALKVAGGHFQGGRLGEAKAAYQAILRDHPGSAGALHFLGLIAHREGDPERAIDLLERAVAQTGTVPFFHGNLGEVYRALGRYDDAVASCRKALELYPVYPEALNTLGAALMELGELEEAETTLERAIEFKPDLAEAHANLGNAWLALGHREKAVGAYRSALRHDPRLVEVYAALGRALREQGKWDEAVAGYYRAVEIAPRHRTILNGLGVTLSEMGRLDDALAAFRQVIDLKPDDSEAHTNMGNTLRRLGRIEDALSAYQRAIELRPDLSEAHCNKGFALEKMHRMEEARSAAVAALELSPKSARAGLLLARLDRRCGALQKARQNLDSLLQRQLEPADQARISVELGHTLDKSGLFSDAFAAFERGQALFADSEAPGTGGQAYLDLIDRNLRWFTEDRVAGWRCRVKGSDTSSPIFLVGFPRSGTTLVEQILASHRAVKTSGEAPIVTNLARGLGRILDRAAGYPESLRDLTAREIRALRAAYWEEAGRSVDPDVRSFRLVDKFPLNTVHVGLIHRIFPDAKIVVALRDPRDVCLSCLFQAFEPNEGMVHFSTLQDTARLYVAVMALWRQYRDVLDLDFFQYRYEDLVTDPRETAGNLLDFLGLGWDDRIMRYHEVARHRYVSTPSYEGVAEPIYDRSVGRWRNYRSQLEPVLEILQPFVEEFGYA